MSQGRILSFTFYQKIFTVEIRIQLFYSDSAHESASQELMFFIPKCLSAAIHLKLVVPSVCHEIYSFPKES